MYKGNKIGVVIPAYNVERFIKDTIDEVPAFVDRIYIIDDGCYDNTANIVQVLSNHNVYLVQHGRNKGPGAATVTGYQAALKDKMDIVVKLDGDGQMPSERIEHLIMPIIENGVDYTKGDRLSNPAHRGNIPKFRLFGNILLTGLTRIASGYWHLSDSQNGFVAISKRALENIDVATIYPYYGYLNDILVRLSVNNFRVLDIPMPAKYQGEKSSIKYKFYIPKVSFLLLRRFLWRLWRKFVTA